MGGVSAPASVSGMQPAAKIFRGRLSCHSRENGFMFLLEQVVNGLVLGGYYLLIALGLSLIFSVGGVVNLAHGAFYAFGAYASVEITKYLGFGPAVVLSPVAVGMLGIVFELVASRGREGFQCDGRPIIAAPQFVSAPKMIERATPFAARQPEET